MKAANVSINEVGANRTPMRAVTAVLAFAAVLALLVLLGGCRADGSCAGPALPGHTAPRIPNGTVIVGTDGGNGIGSGDRYECHDGRVTVK